MKDKTTNITNETLLEKEECNDWVCIGDVCTFYSLPIDKDEEE